MAPRNPRNDDDSTLPTGDDTLVPPVPTVAASEPVTATVDPFMVLAQLAEAMNRLAERQNTNETQTQELMATLGTALARVADANLKGSEQIAAEMRKSNRPSNEIVPMRSVFNQRGVLLEDYQKPPLKCMMFIPWVAEWESLTREEVELLNLLQPGTYTVTFNDDEQFTMTVKAEYAVDGKTMSRLLMNNDKAFTQENQRRVLPLRVMLREMIAQLPGGPAALAVVLTEKEEAALIEAGKLTVSQ